MVLIKEVWPGLGVNCLANSLPGKQVIFFSLVSLVSFLRAVDTGGDLMQQSLWHAPGNMIAKMALISRFMEIKF